MRTATYRTAGQPPKPCFRAVQAPTAVQTLVTDLDTLLGWHAELDGRIVLKPVRSAATTGIYFCRDAAELTAAFTKLIGTGSALGVRNHQILAQEHLIGAE